MQAIVSGTSNTPSCTMIPGKKTIIIFRVPHCEAIGVFASVKTHSFHHMRTTVSRSTFNACVNTFSMR
jgi:hypothetical protein